MPYMNAEDARELNRKRDLLGEIKGSEIVEVVSFDSKKMTVNVKPLVAVPDGDKFQNPPIILKIPVMPVMYGSGVFRPWYKKGDVGMIMYLDRDSDRTLQTGEASNPATSRRHSGNDAVFVGSICAGSHTVPDGLPEGSLAMASNDGGTYISASDSEIEFEGNLIGVAKQDLSNVKLAEDPSKKDYVLTLNADGTVSFQPQKEGGDGQSAVEIEFKTLALPKPILVNDSKIEQDPAELESKVLALPKPIFIQDYQTIENFY